MPLSRENKAASFVSPLAFFEAGVAYLWDASQRWILFLDLLRQRGNVYFEQQARELPDVLLFESEVLADGRALPRPVNYLLMQIKPPGKGRVDPLRRPFVVFDPRAGQGPGIGGLKKDSEIGLALAEGHPVYFASFLPRPVPGQTVEDVCAAMAHFVRLVIARHPQADKPCLIGNCQAGWQIALMCSLHPRLPGILFLAGAPLSYWAGARGQSPARYTAGMVGGSWLNAFLSDLGGGLFDGAWLVQAFELGNPANTFWRKPYGVYAKVDTEGPRFLDFERWWGTPVLLEGDEMQFIADELFIGNRLTQGKIHASDGRRADLRNIKSPIVVFCSRGDDITPPGQALGWILDLYACDDDILAHEQTIVYSLHEKVGHLGLFVSSAVMRKEHLKFISNVDMIESLPPGLYEACFLPKNEAPNGAALASGDDILRFEKRSLEDIRALGVNGPEEDRMFEAVSRLSENIQGLYYTFISPFVRSAVTSSFAEGLRQSHPLRVSFAFFSDKNPFVAPVGALAAAVRAARRPVEEDNAFWQAQTLFSKSVESFFDALGAFGATLVENAFILFYGAPLVQAGLGLRTVRPYAKPPPGRDVQLEEERQDRLKALLERIEEGGLAEAALRGLLYVVRAANVIDERAFRTLSLLRKESRFLPDLDGNEYRALARRQYMTLVLDEERAVQAIPVLLDRAQGREKEALDVIRKTFASIGPLLPEETRRLERLAALFVPAGREPRRRKTDRK